jgi:hypothetical protein
MQSTTLPRVLLVNVSSTNASGSSGRKGCRLPRLSTIDASRTFGFIGGRLRGIAVLITAADTSNLKTSRDQYILRSIATIGHRPHLGHASRIFSAFKTTSLFAEKRLVGRCVPHLGDRSTACCRRAGTVRVIEKHRAGPLSIACTRCFLLLLLLDGGPNCRSRRLDA